MERASQTENREEEKRYGAIGDVGGKRVLPKLSKNASKQFNSVNNSHMCLWCVPLSKRGSLDHRSIIGLLL